MPETAHRVAMWLALATLAHLVLAAVTGLSPDEAHYALYGAHLDWSYYDHPPLVGWLQALPVAIGGADVLLRIVPMACWVFAAYGVLRLSDALHPDTEGGPGVAARWALALLLASPITHLLGFALVPDTLLLALTPAVMLVTWRLTGRAGRAAETLDWVWLGVLLGLAGLAKYTAVFLALGTAIVLFRAHGLCMLRERGVWLALLIALLMITPVLWWNARHEWISFAYQLGHAAGQQDWLPRRVALFALVQVLGFGVLPLVGVWWSLRRRGGDRKDHEPLIFCAAFAVPALLAYLYLSGRGSTLPHWAAPSWLALLPAAGAACARLAGSARRWLRGLLAWQFLSCAALGALLLTAGVGVERDAQKLTLPGRGDSGAANPFADLYGWDEAAVRARALAARHGVAALAVRNWSLASRVAWYARPLPVRVLPRHYDQFDLWFGAVKPGDSVLLVDWSRMSFPLPEGPGQFAGCQWLDSLPVRHAGRQIAHFNFLLCRNWQGSLEKRRGFPD